MKKVFLFLKKEILELISPTLFFYAAFSVQALLRNLVAEEYGISLIEHASTFVTALIVAKSILVVDMLPFARKVGSRHLIVNVFWKILLNISVILVFRTLEKIIPMISKYGGLAAAGRQATSEFEWSQFWITLIVHLLFLIIYSGILAMIQVLGRRGFLDLLTGPTDHGPAD